MDAETQELIRAMADRMEAMERELSAARNQQHLDDTGFIALARRRVGDLVTMEQMQRRALLTGMVTEEQFTATPEPVRQEILDLINYFVAGGR